MHTQSIFWLKSWKALDYYIIVSMVRKFNFSISNKVKSVNYKKPYTRSIFVVVDNLGNLKFAKFALWILISHSYNLEYIHISSVFRLIKISKLSLPSLFNEQRTALNRYE